MDPTLIPWHTMEKSKIQNKNNKSRIAEWYFFLILGQAQVWFFLYPHPMQQHGSSDGHFLLLLLLLLLLLHLSTENAMGRGVRVLCWVCDLLVSLVYMPLNLLIQIYKFKLNLKVWWNFNKLNICSQWNLYKTRRYGSLWWPTSSSCRGLVSFGHLEGPSGAWGGQSIIFSKLLPLTLSHTCRGLRCPH